MNVFMDTNRGNGYDWEAGKSRNAVWAEEEGKFPASTLAKIYSLETQAISELLIWEEWHHTSGAFNKTYYYSREDVEENLDKLKKEARKFARREKSRVGIFILFIIVKSFG